MPEESLPILIVGAGPAGLTLALSLKKNRIPVRVIERNTQSHGAARGTAITPRSLEAFQFLGLVNDVLEMSTPPLLMATYGPDDQFVGEKQWSEPAEKMPNVPYIDIASASQAETEKIIRKHLSKLGVPIELGTEFLDFKQDSQSEAIIARVCKRASDGHEEEEAIPCQFLIGADGARGETRQADRLLTANVYVSGVDHEHWHFWGQALTAMIALKPLKPQPLFQLQSIGPELSSVLPTSLDGLRELFKNISKRDDIVIQRADWVSEWRANIRVAHSFDVGRVFLVGDAAHCHSPMGGQGMNTGIQDSMNLAWKLALVYRGTASQELLKTYDAERIPIIAKMLDISKAA